MFDLGWMELMLIGIVALIVVGPKDLPGMFRTVGKFVGKAKGMAREFSKAMNDAADESGVRDVTDSLRKATNPVGSAMDEVRKSAASFTQATRDAGKPKDKAADKPAVSTLSPERQADIEAIRKSSHDTATTRLAAEKAAADAAKADPGVTAQPATPKAAPKKAAPKRAASKTAAKAATKTTTRKPATAKTTAAKSAAAKPAAPKRTPKPRAPKAASAKQSTTPESKA
ncbi:Sec-independent protein translocase protein TatB [Rhodobacteraceae bacterium KMM 6894]|nr:Sec-independent protein translocase protein TatB [Rhodobacteraceae bacterium KMM 6894]